MTRIATVSYLNARPLIHDLDREHDVEIIRRVPSELLATLENGTAEVALCPVIDYQRSTIPLDVVPSGAIGCDGPALTVKLFSRKPFEELGVVAVDGDSHTSAALLTIIARSVLGREPELVRSIDPTDASEAEAVLLIGDKVIHRPPDPTVFDRTLDLGAAWKQLTGAPFVFATWMTPRGTELGDLPARLDRLRTTNHDRLADIGRLYGTAAGWPDDMAVDYLTRNLRYELGGRELRSIEAFWRLCREHGVIDEVRPMRLYESRES
jgi:chorismate dehydratase